MKREMKIKGGCHCGEVRFSVTTDQEQIEVQPCSCSICSMSGFLHWIIPSSRFELSSGEESLTEFRFNTGTARHLFCRTCGIKSFYVPRSNPTGFSINVHCLDPQELVEFRVTEAFDGKNWEANAASLAHLSEDQ